MKKTKLCPYKATSGNRCHHKWSTTNCPYNNPEKCLYYNEWLKQRKSKIEPINTTLNTTQELSNE